MFVATCKWWQLFEWTATQLLSAFVWHMGGNVSTDDAMDGFSAAMPWLIRYGDVNKRRGWVAELSGCFVSLWRCKHEPFFMQSGDVLPRLLLLETLRLEGRTQILLAIYKWTPKELNAYTRESQMKTLKVWYKFETQLYFLVSLQQWYSWFEEWQTVGNGDYIEKWSHCAPFVFSKLRDKKLFKVFILTHPHVLALSGEITTKLLFNYS